jgi:hypothetical protein
MLRLAYAVLFFSLLFPLISSFITGKRLREEKNIRRNRAGGEHHVLVNP